MNMPDCYTEFANSQQKRDDNVTDIILVSLL